MEQKNDPADLERRLEQVTRLSSAITDQTTVERLRAFADELRQKLRQALARRRARLDERAVRSRARELWEQNGRPAGRDEEFWFEAERELRDARDVNE